jgi:hypothetical protein
MASVAALCGSLDLNAYEKLRNSPATQPAGRDGVSPLREQRESVINATQPRQRRQNRLSCRFSEKPGETGVGVALAPLTRL